MRAHIINKASEDDSFRSKVLSDPAAAIEDELGISIPSGVNVEVHENTSRTVHLVLPPSPKLSSEEMRAVSGGGGCYTQCDSCIYK